MNPSAVPCLVSSRAGPSPVPARPWHGAFARFGARTTTLLIAILLLAGALPARAATDMLHGQVFYRERILLPPDAVVEVQLLDVSRADASSLTLASKRIAAEQRNPVPFVVRFNPTRIKPGHSYVLAARITAGGHVLFRSTRRYPVFDGTPGPIEIRVEKVPGAGPQGAAPDPRAESPVGRWLAEDIGGGGVIDRAQTTLEIAADGQVSGSGGCNRYSGKATIRDNDIQFGAMAVTRMACPPAQMEQEARFFAALKDVRGWRIDQARRRLYLLGARGTPLVRFSSKPAP